MKKITKATSFLLIMTFLLAQAGCTKEKAETLKGAAEQFNVEAQSALTVTADLLKESVAMPAQSGEEELKKMVKSLSKNGRNDAALQTFVELNLGKGNEADAAMGAIDNEFKSMAADYDLFASIFRSLPRGHWFSKDAVAKAERHSIRLTARFIKMADGLQKNPVQFSSRRTDLVVKLKEAQAIADPLEQNQAYMLAAQQILGLRAAERKANDNAIMQCLRAAETGKAVAELIDNFGKFTVADMLNVVKDGLDNLNAVTGGTNPDVKNLVTQYDAFVKNKIKTDDVWKDVLTNELGWTP